MGKSAKTYIGVDFGGTNLRIAAVRDGEEVPGTHQEVVVDLTRSDTIIESLVTTIRGVAEQIGAVAGVGVGIAALVKWSEGRVVTGSNLNLHDLPLRATLAAQLDLPVVVDNDAKAALLAEVRDPNEVVAMVTLGTGVGFALYDRGQVSRGHDGFAGEFGHSIIDPHGPVCPSGHSHHGCAESFLSGQSLARIGTEVANENLDSALYACLKEAGDLRGEDVTAAANAGDAAALRIFVTYSERLGDLLTDIILFAQPSRITLAGGLAREHHLFLQAAIDRAYQQAYTAAYYELEIAPAEHRDHAGVIGAARLAAHELRQQDGKDQ